MSTSNDTMEDKREPLMSESRDEPILPINNIPAVPKPTVHPAVYVIVWIALSSSVILFNKKILDKEKGLNFPIFLTTWHLIFATIATQVLARTSSMLDGLKTVKMTGKVYLRAVVPIGFFFSLSLICSNQAYLYLSVSFIQMLKATTPVAVLLAGWALGKERPTARTFGNVSIIGIGVIIASYGEIKFVMVGFVFQALGVAFEATRLALMEKLLNSAEYKMDPLVSLYYFAPVCAAMNFVIFLCLEASSISLDDIFRVGPIVLLLNALVAFALNVSVVFLIGKTSSLVLTLCGVLKDILLVVISVTWIHDPVKPLQIFGYSIALTGLVVYKLGADKLREHYGRFSKEGALRWNEYGTKYPAYRKAAVFGICAFVVLLLFLTYSNGANIDITGTPDAVANAGGASPHVKRGLGSIISAF
ncbi:hypothetical protein H072_5498 [Dactylellina haptotyla CBS 200.50]|uniref:Sugar phosphate transporter domain-containing protein n=1 Tax=Dactylellina haptotyla (strain CBS 200.50) TaxID=1284197 RepID=S8ACG5_DACHA|nr:hypothetical protein H072_5498 [Dactylellina haptotyla CBS 200.50]